MSLTPKNQRFPYDEEGKIIESATTMYQIAEKRVKKIREEDFFRNGAPDDFFVVPKKIDIKKDTVCVKTKPAYPIVSCRGRVCLPEDTKQTVFGRANLAPTN